MVGSIPVLKAREVVSILEKLGYTMVRQRGSHCQFRKGASGTTVPVHPGRDLSPQLLRQIAADIGMTVHEFLAHR